MRARISDLDGTLGNTLCHVDALARERALGLYAHAQEIHPRERLGADL